MSQFMHPETVSIDKCITDIAQQGLVITCEHGGNRIPAPYHDLFHDYQSQLNSHRGFDPGALVMAKVLARTFAVPLVSATVSRLLVDLNRSVGHPRLYSEVIRNTPVKMRQHILQQYYQPYRTQAERLVSHAIADHGRVIHLSSHSFTPELDGIVRNADIGLLYDPARPSEVDLCERWKGALKTIAPTLRVRRNYPYAGKGDGLTAWFRRRLPPDVYVGIELEINQKHVFKAGRQWAVLRQIIIESLFMVLANRPARVTPSPT